MTEVTAASSLGARALVARWNVWLDELMPVSADAGGRPLSSIAPWAVWAAFAVLAVHEMAVAQLAAYFGIDAWGVWKALNAFAEGRDPFDPSLPYVYLPSTLGALFPFGFLPREIFKLFALVLTVVAVPGGAMLSARLSGLPARSWAAALLTLASAAAGSTLWQFTFLNVLSLSVLALPVILALWRAGRWQASAWLIGITVTIKPMLVPLGWFALVDRRWRALVTMAVLPLAFSVVGLAIARDWTTYFTEAVPFLLGGESEELRPALTSLLPVGIVAGWPPLVVTTVRVSVAAAALVLATLLWRRRTDPTLRVVEPTGLLLAASFLSFSAALSNYLLLLMPLLASAAIRGSIARNGVAWVALAAGAVGPLPGGELGPGARWACLTLLAAFLAWCWSAVRVLRSDGPASTVPSATGDDARSTYPNG
jgi:arabinofuranan 3-O-arabinosyltransferase